MKYEKKTCYVKSTFFIFLFMQCIVISHDDSFHPLNSGYCFLKSNTLLFKLKVINGIAWNIYFSIRNKKKRSCLYFHKFPFYNCIFIKFLTSVFIFSQISYFLDFLFDYCTFIERKNSGLQNYSRQYEIRVIHSQTGYVSCFIS